MKTSMTVIESGVGSVSGSHHGATSPSLMLRRVNGWSAVRKYVSLALVLASSPRQQITAYVRGTDDIG